MRNVAPHDEDAERHVLGSLLIDPQAINRVIPILGERQTAFFKTSHQLIYAAVLSLVKKNEPIDLFTVSTELKLRGDLQRVGSVGFLDNIQESVPSAVNVEHYAGVVQECFIRRQLIDAGASIINRSKSNDLELSTVVDDSQRLLFDICSKIVNDDGTDALGRALQGVETAFETKRDLLGMPMGYPALDRLLSGLTNGDLFILAARPSMGKSALAHNLMLNLALREGISVGLATLEMSAESIWLRMLATEARVDMSRLQSGQLTAPEWMRLASTVDKFKDIKVYVLDNSAISIVELRSEFRRLKMEDPNLGAIFVDYIQLLGGGTDKNKNREQEIADYSRNLKALALELNIPVVALSQLNRAVEFREDKHPQLSDLRESGSIEQDSDVVLFLYRDSYYNSWSPYPGLVEVRVAKHRNGPTGSVVLHFQQECLLFSPLDSYGYD